MDFLTRIVDEVIILFLIGITALKSASGGAGGNIDEYNKQIIWFAIGLLFFFLFSFLDYQIIKKISLFIYIIAIVLLVLVLFSPINKFSGLISL